MKITKQQLEFFDGFNRYCIPAHMVEGLESYINHGIKQGSFLHAILCNDFMKACLQADDRNMKNLPAYANFLHNYAPIGCYGSAEKVAAWMEARQSAS